MNLGHQIIKYRQLKQLTQEQLAKKIGDSTKTIVNWEENRNVPNVNQLIKLCEILEVSMNELLEIKTEDANQLLSLIKQLSQNQTRTNRRYFLMTVLSVGVISLCVVGYIISSQINNNKIKQYENQLVQLNEQMIIDYSNLYHLVNDANNKQTIKAYHINFSEIKEDYTKVKIKTSLYEYQQNAKVSYSIEDSQGKFYTIPAYLENDYYINEPFEIGLNDIKCIKIIQNHEGKIIQNDINNEVIKVNDYVKLNPTIDLKSFEISGEHKDKLRIGVDLNRSNEFITTDLKIEEINFILLVNNQEVYQDKMKIDENNDSLNQDVYETGNFKYALNKKDQVQIKLEIVDSINRKVELLSSSCPVKFGRIDMSGIYFTQDGE